MTEFIIKYLLTSIYFQHYARHCKVGKSNVLMPDMTPCLEEFYYVFGATKFSFTNQLQMS